MTPVSLSISTSVDRSLVTATPFSMKTLSTNSYYSA